MQYKDLKEMTIKEWDGKPFRAVVINDEETELCAYDESSLEGTKLSDIIVGYVDGEWISSDTVSWKHAYPIEWNKKPRKRMTNRQLAMWIAKGNGEYINEHKYICAAIGYESCKGGEQVESVIKVRKWGSEEWIEPTTDLLDVDDGSAI